MQSLRTVATGLVVVFLAVVADGYDLLADPLGWILVLVGLAPLHEVLPRHRAVTAAALLSLVVSVLTWVPDWAAGRAVRTDESLGWLVSLPALAFAYLLADALSTRLAAPWTVRFAALKWGFLLAAVLPVLVYGAGWQWLVAPTGLLVAVLDVLLVVWLWSAARSPVLVDPAEPRT